MPQAPDDGRRETRGTFCCSVPQGLSDDLSGESQLVSTQAVPGVTGDLDWSKRTAITTQTAVQRETSATHSGSTRAPWCWHGQPATAATDNLLHGRAKHDTRAERSLGAGVLPS